MLIMFQPRAAALMAAARQVLVPVALFRRPVTRKRHKMGPIFPGEDFLKKMLDLISLFASIKLK